MMKITEVLVAEHATFTRMFDHMERAAAACGTVADIRLMAGLVTSLLRHHGATEEHLVYSVLDHVLEEKGELDCLHHDHQEIDMQLQQMTADQDLATTRRRFKAALAACRKHFRNEEAGAFPLIERVVRPETLLELGRAYLRSHSVAGQRPAQTVSDAA